MKKLSIAELSSFQLSDKINLPVGSGVILNITDDHLDWHKILLIMLNKNKYF